MVYRDADEIGVLAPDGTSGDICTCSAMHCPPCRTILSVSGAKKRCLANSLKPKVDMLLIRMRILRNVTRIPIFRLRGNKCPFQTMHVKSPTLQQVDPHVM